jgi:GABA permease
VLISTGDRLRAKLEQEGAEMPVRMWAYPWLTWAVVIVIPVMLVYMATREASRFDLAMTALIAVVVVAVGIVTSRHHGRSARDLDVDDARTDRSDRV